MPSRSAGRPTIRVPSDEDEAPTPPSSPPQPTVHRLTLLVCVVGIVIGLLTFRSLLSLTSPTSPNSEIESGLARWGCAMSWMSPGYVRLDGPHAVAGGLDSKYSLWLYREGGLQGHTEVGEKAVKRRSSSLCR
jgi:hypothetical protein